MNTGMGLIWIAGASGLLAFLTSLFYFFRRDPKFLVLSEKLELAGGLGIVITIFLLVYHLLVVDTEYSYVFQHSSTDLAWIYRFSALWAGQEGSFLIWTGFIFIMLAITRFTGTGKILRDTELFALMRSVSLFVASVFLLLLVLKNPFSMYYPTGTGIPEVTNWNLFVEPFVVSYGFLSLLQFQVLSSRTAGGQNSQQAGCASPGSSLPSGSDSERSGHMKCLAGEPGTGPGTL